MAPRQTSLPPLFPPDQPPTLEQQRNHCNISTCRKTWAVCKCPPTKRTESITSLLCNSLLFTSVRHLCVFIFYPYIRHSPYAQDDDFSLNALPQWEGWYSAWIRPLTNGPQLVDWSRVHVYPVQVMFHNGTALEGDIDVNGELFVHVPAGRPDDGVGYDKDRGLLRVCMQVSFGLSEEEVKTGCRGWVKRCDGRIDRERRVRCVQAKVGDNYVVELLHGDLIECEEKRVVENGRAFWDEWRCRGRTRFTREQAKVLQLYLMRMVNVSEKRDLAARETAWKDCSEGVWREIKRLKAMLREDG